VIVIVTITTQEGASFRLSCIALFVIVLMCHCPVSSLIHLLSFVVALLLFFLSAKTRQDKGNKYTDEDNKDKGTQVFYNYNHNHNHNTYPYQNPQL
jgi:hypothetical protein